MHTFFSGLVGHAALALTWFALFSMDSRSAQHTPDILWITNAPQPIASLAFSHDGRRLASGSDGAVKLWNLEAKSLTGAFSLPNWVFAVTLSPDGTLMAAGDSIGSAAVWRVPDGTRLWGYTGDSGYDKEAMRSMAFSPDSSVLAQGRGKGISVVTSADNIFRPFSTPERGVYDLRFSPDGTLLASANQDSTASLFRMPEGTLIRDLAGHAKPLTSVDFSPDGTLLATAAADGTARLWRTADGARVRTLEGGGGNAVPFLGAADQARFSADGKTLLTSSNGTMRFWRVADGSLLLTYTNAGNGLLAVSPDGKSFAYAAGPIPGAMGTNAAVVVARWPLLLTALDRRPDGLQLDWQGASDSYQVQRTTNVAATLWENLGQPTPETSALLPLPPTNTFFRVQSLPGPP